MAAGFGLPPGVDDRAAPSANVPVVPHPRLGIDGFADSADEPQRRQTANLGRRRRGVEEVALVLLYRLPETSGVGKGRCPFEYDFGRADSKRSVGDIGMSRHPADVGSTPEDVLGLYVEGP